MLQPTNAVSSAAPPSANTSDPAAPAPDPFGLSLARARRATRLAARSIEICDHHQSTVSLAGGRGRRIKEAARAVQLACLFTPPPVHLLLLLPRFAALSKSNPALHLLQAVSLWVRPVRGSGVTSILPGHAQALNQQYNLANYMI